MTAVSWPPSQWWDGDDGSWSSFALRIGSPEQVVRVLPSTAGQQTWVISPHGCPNDASSPCISARGGVFDPARSSSWKPFGNYSLDLEANLGYDDTAPYGFETVALGFSDPLGGPQVKSQVVSAVATNDYYIGLFGLGHQGTNISNFSDPQPTFLTAMKNESLIPSLSWAYTAGAPYRLKGVFGSLTLGGYDRSRFIPNNVSLSLATDISRDLVVGLHSVTSTSSNDSLTEQTSLLPTPILAFIDSTLPYFYLPVEACKKFERTLGLSWSETDAMYWVNDTLHDSLVASNITFTFTLGDSAVGGPTVQIALPYASFDLEVKSPFESKSMRYFPLQQAYNESEYTLGRAFLQEAYIITDYERSSFSVSQSRFETNSPVDLVSIQSIDKTDESVPGPSASPSVVLGHDHRHRDIVIGASVGAVVSLFLVIVAIFLAIRMRRRRTQKREASQVRYDNTKPYDEKPVELLASVGVYAQEIGNNSLIWPCREVPENGMVELPDEDSPSDDHILSSRTSNIPLPDEVAPQNRQSSQFITTSDMRNLRRTHLSTAMSRSRRANSAPSNGTSDFETMIFACSQSEDFDPEVDSITTSNTKTAIYSSYLREPLDLDRSLPPTPISESPQDSPLNANFIERSSFRQRPLIIPAGSDKSIFTITSPRYPVSSYNPPGRRPVGFLFANAQVTNSTSVWGPGHSRPATSQKGWD